jgi:hypothetical protein
MMRRIEHRLDIDEGEVVPVCICMPLVASGNICSESEPVGIAQSGLVEV